MGFTHSLLKTLLSSSSFPPQVLVTLHRLQEFSTLNLWLFFICPRESQLFFTTTALQDESYAQSSNSLDHPEWGHLPLFILFLSPGMPFSTTCLHSNIFEHRTFLSSILWAPAVILCVLSWYCTKNILFTFFVLIFKSILIISKHLLDTYCVPDIECCGYINMNKILSWSSIQFKEVKYKVYYI